MKKPHCISLHYSARPYLNMLIMMMNIMLMRIKRIMIPVTMAENDGDRPYLNSTRLKSEHGGHIAAVVNFDADHTSMMLRLMMVMMMAVTMMAMTMMMMGMKTS